MGFTILDLELTTIRLGKMQVHQTSSLGARNQRIAWRGPGIQSTPPHDSVSLILLGCLTNMRCEKRQSKANQERTPERMNDLPHDRRWNSLAARSSREDDKTRARSMGAARKAGEGQMVESKNGKGLRRRIRKLYQRWLRKGFRQQRYRIQKGD